MEQLTFKSVINNDFELVYEIPKEVGERYEELTSFRHGRDFNRGVRDYMENFVAEFEPFRNETNEAELNKRLIQYNKLVVDLRSKILSTVKTPSILISGGSNFPVAKKKKEVERLHAIEAELYSENGKHTRFIENTRKMFDPILIKQQEKTEKMRKEQSKEKGWVTFYEEVEHDELSGYGIDFENSRVYLTTHGKPSDEVRTLLKRCALRWSPKNQRWQRILTDNAINSLIITVFNTLELNVNIADFTKKTNQDCTPS